MRTRARPTVTTFFGLACLVVSGILVLGGAVLAAGGGQDRSGPSGSVDPQHSPHGRDVANAESCPRCHSTEPCSGADWGRCVTATCLACHDHHGHTGASPESDPSDARAVTGHETALAHPSEAPSGLSSGLSSPLSGHVVSAYPDSASSLGGPDGLQCTSCHTFHGEPDLVVNGWTRHDEGRRFWWQDPDTGAWSLRNLHFDDASRTWQVCGARNTDCRPAEVLDAGGRLVPLYGYKLLTTRPGGISTQVRSYGTQPDARDTVAWCGACHPSHIDRELGGTLQNHPTACDTCHGDPANGSSTGFPHTSSHSALLTRYPDDLCIQCHVSGSLP